MFSLLFFFFFNDTATTEIYTLSLHDALPIFQRVARRLIEPFDEMPLVLHGLHPGERALAGGRLDAAHARSDAALGDDLEEADVAGAGDVRAPAQLARGADVQNPHLVAVLLAEQGHATAFDGVVELHDARRSRLVSENFRDRKSVV